MSASASIDGTSHGEPHGVEPASPFHAGETAVQSRLGVRETVEPRARKVVREFLPDQHRAFYAQLPFLVVGARDAQGRPWASLLAGAPGFVSSPDAQRLDIAAAPGSDDPISSGLRSGADVGLLGIWPEKRRRNRVNGRAEHVGEDGFSLHAEQSFGNCPQYIARRRPVAVADRNPGPAWRAQGLPAGWRERIAEADTFFIASGHRGEGESPSYGMDVSHRGGPPGFVEIEAGEGGRDVLVFPDYKGNLHYNTLGNLAVDPRAGLVFLDFEAGHLLQLTGRSEIIWDVPDPDRFAGPAAERWVRFEIDEVVERTSALPLRFESVDSPSPTP